MPRVVKLRLEQIQRDFLWGGKALEKRSHLVKWAKLFVQIKRRVAWELEVLLFSIGSFCASGVGALQLKRSPCGSLLLVGSLVRKEEVGVPVK